MLNGNGVQKEFEKKKAEIISRRPGLTEGGYIIFYRKDIAPEDTAVFLWKMNRSMEMV